MKFFIFSLLTVFCFLFTGFKKEVFSMEDFKPVIESVQIMPLKVRPGDVVEYTINFINQGSQTAENEYRVFVHFEYPEKNCSKIVLSGDHKPLVPTIAWEPNRKILDGPFTVRIPENAAEGTYYVHVGVYQWEPVHIRFCEEYAGEIVVDKNAPPLSKQITPISASEVDARRKAVAGRIKNPVAIESEFIKLNVGTDGIFEVLDKQSGVTWYSNAQAERFGDAVLDVDGKKQFVSLDKFKIAKELSGFKLTHESGNIALNFKLLGDGKTLEIFYDLPKNVSVVSIKFLENGMWVTDADKGYALTPTRMGLLMPADNKVVFSRQFTTFTYEGCDLEMMGMIKQGSALLISWHDPYVVPEIRSRFVDLPIVPGRQIISTTFNLSKTAKSLRLIFLGKGDATTIAQAYRKEAKEKGWISTWDEKIKKCPDTKKLFGASNVKLWSCFARIMSEDSKTEKSRRMNWTFDEAAQVAEHIKNDLKIDKVLFMLGGWMQYGYDNQHPDILPAAPACGGNEALADCVKRVKSLGYLMCFHDNYQDMYLDAPSYDEDYIMRNPGGELVRGGMWNGGKCYITCSKKALELAKRPDKNLPEVKRLFAPNSYFIDTTFAAGLLECYSPGHPIDKWGDMKYKQELSDYSRSLFGVFGSECGKEWAIPHSEFFEGIGGVSGRYYHNEGLLASVGGIEIPLFSMIYHDCIAIYGKYGYAWAEAAPYVMYHLSGGYTLNYHSIGAHLYWQSASSGSRLPLAPSVSKVEQKGPNKFEITYSWKVTDNLDKDWKVFVHFTNVKYGDKNREGIAFQNDHSPSPPTNKWEQGVVKQGPFTVEIPSGFEGDFPIMIGMWDGSGRASLQANDSGGQRYKIGVIKVDDDKITFVPSEVASGAEGPDASVFCRADNGWAEGMCTTDIFLKNTHEMLSPLHEITANMNITKFEFLTDDYKVRRSTFGNNEMQVTVNAGDKNYEYKCIDDNTALLPPYGFVIESPNFVVFNALSWNGLKYDKSVLFTVRSLDGKPIDKSGKLRIFHGFGDSRIKIKGSVRTIQREEIIM